MKKPGIIQAVEPIIEALNQLGLSYYVGGSVASSAYGLARATLDVDMVSNLTEIHVKPFHQGDWRQNFEDRRNKEPQRVKFRTLKPE